MRIKIVLALALSLSSVRCMAAPMCGETGPTLPEVEAPTDLSASRAEPARHAAMRVPPLLREFCRS